MSASRPPRAHDRRKAQTIVGAGFGRRALANVVVEEQLVDAVADRLLADEANAAVLYATDVASGSRPAARDRASGRRRDRRELCHDDDDDPGRASAWVDGLAAPSSVAIA